MSTLLIIDDDENVRYSFRYALETAGLEVLTAATGSEGLNLILKHDPDAVLLDIQLPDGSGLEIFQEIQGLEKKRPVVFITGHGTMETALEAMKQGAFDYLVKPVNLDQVSRLLGRALKAAQDLPVPTLQPLEEKNNRLVGSSPLLQEMCKTIGRLAPQNVNVLILGESGAGKELVAHALYQHSRRANKPFLAINCAAIPETLQESELFGHEPGAFTGAQSRRIGKFELCDGGTLFLDEIGDMAPQLQAKMLRLLENQQFERLGGNQTLQTSVRILAATNQDLGQRIKDGRFRLDLYYRLKEVTIRVPSLRDRFQDIPELADYFLARFNQEFNLRLRELAPETLTLLQNYAWPGNVREFQGVLKEGMLQANGPILLPEFLPPEIRQPQEIPFSTRQTCELNIKAWVDDLVEKGQPNLYMFAIEALEQILLPRVLYNFNGNQTQASALLGIGRGTLRQKLRALGLFMDKVLSDSREDDEDRLLQPNHEFTEVKERL